MHREDTADPLKLSLSHVHLVDLIGRRMSDEMRERER